MPGSSLHVPRSILLLLAGVFAAATVLFAGLWMAAMWPAGGPAVTVELGFDTNYVPAEHASVVSNVWPDTPAQHAGIRPGDRIEAVDGAPVIDAFAVTNAWREHRPGDLVHLLIRRPGRSSPLLVTARFRPISADWPSGWLGQYIRASFPLPFVVVGLVVLFLRVEDRNVWLLALLCASFTTTAGAPTELAWMPAPLRLFALGYQSLFLGFVGPLFYFFFAVFPARSPLDRRLPWLKWLALVLGLSLGVAGTGSGSIAMPPPIGQLVGSQLSMQLAVACLLAFFALGLVSLTLHFVHTTDVQARRKIRVIYWGTALGVAPGLAQATATNFTPFRSPLWLSTLIPVISYLFPLSFAYAVVKHRVLEIPALIRRSARYLLVQRGFTAMLSLFSVALTVVFAFGLVRYAPVLATAGAPLAVGLGALFGTGLLWGGTQVHRRVSDRIDRRFFRRAYDARVILEDLAEKMSTANTREEVAELLDHHLTQALQPRSLVVYLEDREGQLHSIGGAAPPGFETLSRSASVVAELSARREPWEVAGAGEEVLGAQLAALRPDCLVPVRGRSGRLAGVIVLGMRLSEEPYSGEDKRLLASVAGQAGTALENIRLAEDIAERTERERRTAREMEIATEVQARLLPSAPPVLPNAHCAAQCRQARAVGGDCYDFLPLRSGRVGLVLADVSGKGIHAALLMANLLAHLRSQSGIAPDDPASVLRGVNRAIYSATAAQHYATLFFGVFDDESCALSYVNCGHLPPVLLRGSGDIERLMPTAPVIGLFDETEWSCSVGQTTLCSGDLLAIFSDGVTEAMRGEAEYGEERFIAQLKARRLEPPAKAVSEILDGVQQFCGGQASDDLTLMVLRVG